MDSERDLSDLRVLVVEDCRFMLELLRDMVRAMGVRRVMTAGEGGAALGILAREGVDFVISDWHMAPIDGGQMLRRLRADTAGLNCKVPVAIVTAEASRERLEAARAAGANLMLAKPVSAGALRHRIIGELEQPMELRALRRQALLRADSACPAELQLLVGQLATTFSRLKAALARDLDPAPWLQDMRDLCRRLRATESGLAEAHMTPLAESLERVLMLTGRRHARLLQAVDAHVRALALMAEEGPAALGETRLGRLRDMLSGDAGRLGAARGRRLN